MTTRALSLLPLSLSLSLSLTLSLSHTHLLARMTTAHRSSSGRRAGLRGPGLAVTPTPTRNKRETATRKKRATQQVATQTTPREATTSQRQRQREGEGGGLQLVRVQRQVRLRRGVRGDERADARVCRRVLARVWRGSRHRRDILARVGGRVRAVRASRCAPAAPPGEGERADVVLEGWC